MLLSQRAPSAGGPPDWLLLCPSSAGLPASSSAALSLSWGLPCFRPHASVDRFLVHRPSRSPRCLASLATEGQVIFAVGPPAAFHAHVSAASVAPAFPSTQLTCPHPHPPACCPEPLPLPPAQHCFLPQHPPSSPRTAGAMQSLGRWPPVLATLLVPNPLPPPKDLAALSGLGFALTTFIISRAG